MQPTGFSQGINGRNHEIWDGLDDQMEAPHGEAKVVRMTIKEFIAAPKEMKQMSSPNVQTVSIQTW